MSALKKRLLSSTDGSIANPRVDVDVVAVDDDFLESVGRCARCSRMLDGGDQVDGCVLHVEVVLADEYHREFPNGGEVECLVERPDVRTAITEEAHGDLVTTA